MAGVLAALVVTVVLLWTPGLALSTWLLPHTSRLTRVAVAPALSFGLLFALASYLDVLGVRVQWASVGLPVLLVAVVGLVVLARRRGWGRLSADRARLRLTPAHVVLALSVVVAFGLWCYAIRSPTTVPTYDDGANAGIFTYRIGLLGTVRPDQIIATDLGDGAGGVSYYPLALHLVASFLVALTGLDVGAALHVEVATVVAVCLPVGAFALTRRLLERAPLPAVRPGVAAAAAGLGGATLPGLPWGQLPWGALALVSGVALMPAPLLLALDVPRHRARAGVALAAATAGLFVVHSSEVASVVVLGLAMVVALLGRDGARWRAASAALLTAAAVGLVLLGPVLPSLAGGLNERAAGTPGVAVGPWQAVQNGWFSLISAPQLGDVWGGRQLLLAWLVSVLAVIGAVAARRSPVVLGLLAGSGTLALVAWGCMIGSSLAFRLGTPWYANGYRLLATLSVPLLVLTGIGVARVAGQSWGRVADRLAPAVLGLLAVAVAVPAVAVSGVLGSRTYDAYSAVTAADRDAYAWLGAHVTPGDRVLNDSHDGSMWMYPLAGVAPVFAPKSDLWTTPAWDDRWYLLHHADQLATDARAQQIARELSVTYALVGARLVYGERRQLDADGLAASPAWREVFASGGARVFAHLAP